MKYTEHDVAQRSPEWFALRKGRITGSNFGSALDVSAYTSSRALQKEILTDRPFKGNMHTRHGTSWESTAIEEYKRKTGFGVREMGFATPDELDYVGVSPDGIIETPYGQGLAEFKCPSTRATYGGVPLWYMCQVQGNMRVLGLKWGHFVVFRPRHFGGREFAMYDRNDDPLTEWSMEVWVVEESAEFQDALFEGLAWFNRMIKSGTTIPTKREAKANGWGDAGNPYADDLRGCKLSVHLDEGMSVRPPK